LKGELLIIKDLLEDVEKPEFIQKILRPRMTTLTVWPYFNGRRPAVSERERYYCVVKGEEEFRIVSPVYKQNIYSGVLEELQPNESPIDFFSTNVDSSKFPLYSETKVLGVTLKAGQCMFVPAFYWVQSETKTGNEHSILVNYEFETHSELLNLLFQAIDQGILEN
jgi:hypothetical protein